MKYVFTYLLIINIATLCLYIIDKRAAIKQKWRIPNRVLIGFAAFGGTIGALIGMYSFRHKTKTKLYTITVPLFLIIQIIAVMLLLSSCGAEMAASAGSISSDNTAEELAAVRDDMFEDDEDIDEDIIDDEIDDEDTYEEYDSEADADLEEELTDTEDVSDAGDASFEIILNSNPSRMRYHLPDCRGVKQISKEHYQKFELTKEEIKEKQDTAGWIPCGWCHPDVELGID